MTDRPSTRLFGVLFAMGLAACGGTDFPAPSQISAGPGAVAGAGARQGGDAAALIEVAGTVRDAAGRTLNSARVEVTEGPQTGLATTTGVNGAFTLRGLFDATTRFRATADGHLPSTRPLPVACLPCNPDWWVHFELEADAPHADMTGAYTVTFSANSSCTNLPDEARTRTYEATVTRAPASTQAAGSKFDVRISNAAMLPPFNGFTIGVAGDYVAFDIGDPGHSGAGLVERLAADRYVTLEGSVVTMVAPASTAGITVPLSGAVAVCELAGVFSDSYSCGGRGGVSIARCSSSSHQLIMRRQ